MGAPEGNQFWKTRSTHGRDRIFAEPEILRAAADEYFKHCDDNPDMELDFRGKDATPVHLPKKVPYTLQGLCLFLHVNTNYLKDFRSSLAGRTDEKSKDFSAVLRYIEDATYENKFRGATQGFFNANIIARDLGLSDKQTVVNTDIKGDSIDYSKLSPEVLKQIAEASKDQPESEHY